MGDNSKIAMRKSAFLYLKMRKQMISHRVVPESVQKLGPLPDIVSGVYLLEVLGLRWY